MKKYDSLYLHLRRLWKVGKKLLDGTPEEKHVQTIRWIRSCGVALDRAKEDIELVYPDWYRYPFDENSFFEFLPVDETDEEDEVCPPFFCFSESEPDGAFCYRFIIRRLEGLHRNLELVAKILRETGEVSQEIIARADQAPDPEPEKGLWKEVTICPCGPDLLLATDGKDELNLTPASLGPRAEILWQLLVRIVEKKHAEPDGSFKILRVSQGRTSHARRQQIHRLGEALKRRFERDQSPFESIGRKGIYMPQFVISSEETP